jgi:hypothetical protein
MRLMRRPSVQSQQQLHVTAAVAYTSFHRRTLAGVGGESGAFEPLMGALSERVAGRHLLAPQVWRILSNLKHSLPFGIQLGEQA